MTLGGINFSFTVHFPFPQHSSTSFFRLLDRPISALSSARAAIELLPASPVAAGSTSICAKRAKQIKGKAASAEGRSVAVETKAIAMTCKSCSRRGVRKNGHRSLTVIAGVASEVSSGLRSALPCFMIVAWRLGAG